MWHGPDGERLIRVHDLIGNSYTKRLHTMSNTPIPLNTLRDNLLPYGRTPQSPASISPVDIEEWKGKISPTFKHHFKERYDELVRQYEALVDDYYTNKIVYESSINFEPQMGHIYYLYQKQDGNSFLSLVEPEHAFWNGFIGKFRLNAQYAWEKVE